MNDALKLIAFLALLVWKRDKGKLTVPGTEKKKPSDVEAWIKRANQAKAAAWIPDMVALGAPPDFASAVARWIGIESGGNPQTRSLLGERGLTQVHPSERTDGAFTEKEWQALTDPKTPRAELARLALHHVAWLWTRAKKHVTDWPDNPIDQVWAAKLYHARPVSFRDAHPSGGWKKAAVVLAAKWANHPNDLKRLKVATIIANGDIPDTGANV